MGIESKVSALPAVKVALLTSPLRFIMPLPSGPLVKYGLCTFVPWFGSTGWRRETLTAETLKLASCKILESLRQQPTQMRSRTDSDRTHMVCGVQLVWADRHAGFLLQHKVQTFLQQHHAVCQWQQCQVESPSWS